MDRPEMAFDTPNSAHATPNADFSAMDMDFGQFDGFLESNSALTQGLETLGNCNRDDACLDQRCLSFHNSNLGYDTTFQQQHSHAASPMSNIYTPPLQDTNLDLHLHSSGLRHGQLHTPCMYSTEHLQHHLHHSNFTTPNCHIPHHFDTSSRFSGWGAVFQNNCGHDPSFSTVPFGNPFNATQRYDCSSADCNPQCTSQCWEQCDPTLCCFDEHCPEGTGSVCCYEEDCNTHQSCVDETCVDETCQGASNPCTDINCVLPGTENGTVSTTPASASITTPPPLEAEHIIQALVSPIVPSSATESTFDFPLTPRIKVRAESICTEQSMQMSLASCNGSITPISLQAPVFSNDGRQSMSLENEFMCRWVGPDGVVCGKKLENDEQLQSHCKTEHLADLTKLDTGFECRWDGCKRASCFTQKSKLERHMQTHTGYKPVKCDICGMMLSAKQSLEQHKRIHSGEKPWECKYPGCGQAFKQQSALTMHERTHTGAKPLACDICGKRFGESSNLSKHRRIHNKKGNFLCGICGKDFHRQDQLRRHMSTNHKMTPSTEAGVGKAKAGGRTARPAPALGAVIARMEGIQEVKSE